MPAARSVVALAAPGRCAVKALLVALAVAVAPAHVRFAVAGVPVSVPAAWLILAAEILTAAVTVWLAVRVIRRFRSAPWMRPTAGGWPA
jgi:hypothetical protein